MPDPYVPTVGSRAVLVSSPDINLRHCIGWTHLILREQDFGFHTETDDGRQWFAPHCFATWRPVETAETTRCLSCSKAYSLSPSNVPDEWQCDCGGTIEDPAFAARRASVASDKGEAKAITPERVEAARTAIHHLAHQHIKDVTLFVDVMALRHAGTAAMLYLTLERCPTCSSPAPHLHPAVQSGGEVEPCADAFHLRATPENSVEYRELVTAKRAAPPSDAASEAVATIRKVLDDIDHGCHTAKNGRAAREAVTRLEAELKARDERIATLEGRRREMRQLLRRFVKCPVTDHARLSRLTGETAGYLARTNEPHDVLRDGLAGGKGGDG